MTSLSASAKWGVEHWSDAVFAKVWDRLTKARMVSLPRKMAAPKAVEPSQIRRRGHQTKNCDVCTHGINKLPYASRTRICLQLKMTMNACRTAAPRITNRRGPQMPNTPDRGAHSQAAFAATSYALFRLDLFESSQ
jgi:hypothetical protein